MAIGSPEIADRIQMKSLIDFVKLGTLRCLNRQIHVVVGRGRRSLKIAGALCRRELPGEVVVRITRRNAVVGVRRAELGILAKSISVLH
jgi:hypothetical protein